VQISEFDGTIIDQDLVIAEYRKTPQPQQSNTTFCYHLSQVLAAVARAIGFSEPFKLRLWAVKCDVDTPQPFDSPFNISGYSLNVKAFEGLELKLEGAKKYGSNGVLFYEVTPYGILELQDNIAVELEVIHLSCKSYLSLVSLSLASSFYIPSMQFAILGGAPSLGVGSRHLCR